MAILEVRILSAVLLVGLIQTGAPNLDLEELATGPYAQMHMVLEKGFLIFDVDVLSINVRLDEATATRVRRLGGSAAPGKVAEAILDGEDLFLRVEFKRNVSLDRWVSGVRESLEAAWKAGLITENNYRLVSSSLPRWFEVISARGFEQGDQLRYRIYPQRLRTVLVSHDGKVLVDQTDRGEEPRRALLAGYFAPGTDTRTGLIDSLGRGSAAKRPQWPPATRGTARTKATSPPGTRAPVDAPTKRTPIRR